MARRYARALFELAGEQSSLDRIMQELDRFGRLLTTDQRLRAFLLSPRVERSVKTQILETTVAGTVSPLFHRFLLLLVRKGRQNLYQEIAFEMGRLYDGRQNRLRAMVVSATPLSDKQLEFIRQRLRHNANAQAEILIENKIDPTILGGLVIKMKGQVLDASLAHQLDRLRKELQQAKF